jgi:type IV pilus assembly protein PilN
MANINLLPWREQLREENKHQFIILFGIAMAGVGLFLVGLHFYMTYRIDQQNSRNQFLQNQILLLDERIKHISDYQSQKDKIMTRMQTIYNLQSNRSKEVRIFSDLVDEVPAGLFLTSMEKKGHNLTLTGRAESNTVISQLMRNLKASPWFKDPTLKKIENDQNNLTAREVFALGVVVNSPFNDQSGKTRQSSKDANAI